MRIKKYIKDHRPNLNLEYLSDRDYSALQGMINSGDHFVSVINVAVQWNDSYKYEIEAESHESTRNEQQHY